MSLLRSAGYGLIKLAGALALVSVISATAGCSAGQRHRVEDCTAHALERVDSTSITTIVTALGREDWLEATSAAVAKLGPLALCIITALAQPDEVSGPTELVQARAAAATDVKFALIRARAFRYLRGGHGGD